MFKLLFYWKTICYMCRYVVKVNAKTTNTNSLNVITTAHYDVK